MGLRSKTRQSHRARVLPRARDARGWLSPRRGHQRRGGSGVSAVGRTGTGKEATRGKARRDRDAPTRRRPDHRARVLTGWERHRRRWTRSVRELARGGDAPRVPGRVGHWEGAAGYRLGSAGAVQGALEHRRVHRLVKRLVVYSFHLPRVRDFALCGPERPAGGWGLS